MILDRTPSNVSDKYAYISTDDNVEVAAKAGLVLHKIWNGPKQRIDFRFINQVYTVGDISVGLSMRNSFNGKGAYELYLFVFRTICGNGMICPIFGDSIRLVHRGFNPERALTAISQASKHAPRLLESVDLFKRTHLSQAHAYNFARDAIKLRLGEKSFPISLIYACLKANRDEDKGDSVWLTFNRVQENLTRGLSKLEAGQTVRAIKSGQRDADFNKALWTLAESYAKAA